MVCIGALGGLCLPAGAMAGEAGRLLTTFMGFFTAGVLPTISILIGSLTASGRSVKALNDVREELRSAISALIGLLVIAGTTVASMLLLSLPMTPAPIMLTSGQDQVWLQHLPGVSATALGFTLDLAELTNRLGQGLVAGLAILFAVKAMMVPRALYSALDSKHKLAIEEARRAVDERAPKAPEIKKAFSGGSEFGTVVRLDDKVP